MSPLPSRGPLRLHESKLSAIRRSLDAGLIFAAHYLACVLYPQPWSQAHTISSFVAVAVFLLVAQSTGLYRPWRGSPLRRELGSVFSTWSCVVPFLLFLVFASKTSEQFSRIVSMTWLGTAPLLLAAFRVAYRLVLQEFRKRGGNTRTVAIAGATSTGRALAARMEQDPWNGMRFVGFYDDRDWLRLTRAEGEGALRKLDGTLTDLVEAARTGHIDVIYIALPMRAELRVNELVRQLADTTASVYFAADLHVFDLLQARWSSVGEVPVVSIFESPFSGVDGWLKRAEDLVLGTLILAIIAVPMLVIATAVKLTSTGPVFFRQRRYGLNGQVIDVLKFRSMAVMEDGANVRQATKNDPRVTKLGAFLRRTSLDELPQFLHVLTGEMSIVGPRPHAIAHNEQYRQLIQGYMLRHKVKPGITGWAQVNGWRGETDTLEKMEKRVEHDLDYIRKWSLFWDLKIVVMTVLGRRTWQNAY